MSQSGRYRAPLVGGIVATSGSERRSIDPLNQLGRRLGPVGPQAVHPLEIAAHLEALTGSSDALAKEHGANDRFEVAQRLFERIPRRAQVLAPPLRRAPEDAWQHQVASLLALVVTLLFAVQASPATPVAVVGLVIWSMTGSALLARSDAMLGPAQRRSTIGWWALAGVLALPSVLLLGGEPLPLMIAVLWWALAVLGWAHRRWAALGLAMWALLVAVVWQSQPAVAPWVPLLLTTPALILPLWGLQRPDAQVGHWCLRTLPETWPWMAAGWGQGMILVGLMPSLASGSPWPGLFCFIPILLGARWVYRRLMRSWSVELARTADGPSFVTRARRVWLAHVLPLWLLGVVLAWLPELPSFPELWWGEPWVLPLQGLMALAVNWLALTAYQVLGRPLLPALVLVAAGAVIVMYPSFAVDVAWISALALGIAFPIELRRWDRYGVHLL